MFEAKLQSFEDGNERSATTAPRIAALRAELARRALTGIIAPRADRGSTAQPIRSASRRRSSR